MVATTNLAIFLELLIKITLQTVYLPAAAMYQILIQRKEHLASAFPGVVQITILEPTATSSTGLKVSDAVMQTSVLP